MMMNSSKQKYSLKTRPYSGFFINLGILILLSFRMGDFFTGSFGDFYFSYVPILVVPFGLYFIFSIVEIKFALLRRWYVKSFLVFIVIGIVEFIRSAGVPMLAILPYDYTKLYMILIGAISAAAVDVVLFTRWLPSWKYYGKTKIRIAKDANF